MSLKTFSADDLPKAEWADLTGHSFFSSPEFASLWRTVKGRELFIVENDRGAISAGIAGVIFGRKFWRRYQSMPDGFYGGPFFADGYPPDRVDHFINSFTRWLKSNGIIRADIHNAGCEMDSADFRLENTTTHVISLDGGAFRPPDARIREHIRTGKRRGAKVALLNDFMYLDDFYDLAVMSYGRYGKGPRYPKALFAGLLDLSKTDDRILWLMVLSGKKMIGSRICFIEHSQILTWQYYYDKRFNYLKPSFLLLDYIMNFAVENSLTTFNLGWSPPGASGLVDHKERWGGNERIVPNYRYLSPIGRLVYSWRKK